MDSKNIKYIVLTIILLILSVFGIISIFKINPSPLSLLFPTETPIIETKTLETKTVEIETPEVETQVVEITPEASPTSKITPKPTAKPTKKLTPTPTKKPTLIPTPEEEAIDDEESTEEISNDETITENEATSSVPTQLIFSNSNDSFSINYLSNRKVYSGKEPCGNRHTFYSLLGNFAVHIAPSGSWCWTNSSRNFSPNLIVAGQNTYRYDIATQTIVDLQSSDKNYTIQCVHGGKQSLKDECEEFIQSFQLL